MNERTSGASAVVRGAPGRVVGVGFLPAGWAVFTSLPACDYVDNLAPLATFVGEGAADELLADVMAAADDAALVAALDAWFLAHMAGRKAAETLLVTAHQALMDPEVRSVA